MNPDYVEMLYNDSSSRLDEDVYSDFGKSCYSIEWSDEEKKELYGVKMEEPLNPIDSLADVLSQLSI